jgi:hypothetical protein
MGNEYLKMKIFQYLMLNFFFNTSTHTDLAVRTQIHFIYTNMLQHNAIYVIILFAINDLSNHSAWFSSISLAMPPLLFDHTFNSK